MRGNDESPLTSKIWWKISLTLALLDINTPSLSRDIVPFYLVVAGQAFYETVTYCPHCGVDALPRFYLRLLSIVLLPKRVYPNESPPTLGRTTFELDGERSIRLLRLGRTTRFGIG